jgi:hypothetical protein
MRSTAVNLTTTILYHELEAAAERDLRVMVLATPAARFLANDNDRAKVGQSVGLPRNMARTPICAVRCRPGRGPQAQGRPGPRPVSEG